VRALVDLRSVDDTAVGEQALQRVEPMIVVAPRLLTGVVFLPVVLPIAVGCHRESERANLPRGVEGHLVTGCAHCTAGQLSDQSRQLIPLAALPAHKPTCSWTSGTGVEHRGHVFTFLDRHTALLDLLIDSSGEKCHRIERVLHFDYAACRWQRWLGTLRVVDEDLLHHSV